MADYNKNRYIDATDEAIDKLYKSKVQLFEKIKKLYSEVVNQYIRKKGIHYGDETTSIFLSKYDYLPELSIESYIVQEFDFDTNDISYIHITKIYDEKSKKSKDVDIYMSILEDSNITEIIKLLYSLYTISFNS